MIFCPASKIGSFDTFQGDKLGDKFFEAVFPLWINDKTVLFSKIKFQTATLIRGDAQTGSGRSGHLCLPLAM